MRIEKPGWYQLEVVFGCEKGQGGGRFVVSIADPSLTVTVVVHRVLITHAVGASRAQNRPEERANLAGPPYWPFASLTDGRCGLSFSPGRIGGPSTSRRPSARTGGQ